MKIKHRLMRRMREKRKKKVIILSIFVMFVFCSVGYAAFQTNIKVNVKGNIKEKSRIIRSWTNDSVDDFHNAQYRENIVSVTFLDSTNIPSNVVEDWDVSADGKGGVIAYVTINQEDHTKYDLFIGAKDGVIANENSSYLFYRFTGIVSIIFNNYFDTSNVINMDSMFNGCNSIEELDLSSFNTINVRNFSEMFRHCRNLINLDLSSFNTKNVTNMWCMFNDCESLSNLNLSNFDTSNVNGFLMNWMFYNCRNLVELDLSNFNTNNMKELKNMFAGCIKLKVLNLSNFNTTNVTIMTGLFKDCQSLETIYVSANFVTTNVINSEDMFYNDIKLIGGNGTTYDPNHIDKEYARIDTASTPGYFTLKQ